MPRDPRGLGFAQQGEVPPQPRAQESTEGWSDGLTDDERDFRDEVEAGTEDRELYEGLDGWQERWLKRAKERGLAFESAMRILDSIADLDPPEQGYGEGYDE